GGQRSAQQVVNDWMNNPTTRNRLLNPNVTDMGLGYKSLNNDTGNINYGTYWTQVLGSKKGGNSANISSDMTTDNLLSNEETLLSKDVELSSDQGSYQDPQFAVSSGTNSMEGVNIVSDPVDDYQLGTAQNQSDPNSAWQPYSQDVLGTETANTQELVGASEPVI
ncbi:MAG: CAP domain-containing protein, partial [Cyanobacteria bacterium P01_F01_bin.86]